MSHQYLIPAKDVEDAREAIALAPAISSPGDELIFLLISDVPDSELAGSQPPVTVLDPLATTGGVASAPRAASDQPVFIDKEEIMEMRGREYQDALQPAIAQLHQRGFGARVQTAFSDDAAETIRDQAGDLQATDVFATAAMRESLDDDTRELVRPLG